MDQRAPIPISVQSDAADGDGSRGNAVPVLHEIRHALTRLLQTREPTVFDLRSLPFGPGDEQDLEAALGVGEVRADVAALGASEVRETAFPGVWWVVHRGPDGTPMAKFIEVTHVPDILRSQVADIRDGLVRLQTRLSEGPADG